MTIKEKVAKIHEKLAHALKHKHRIVVAWRDLLGLKWHNSGEVDEIGKWGKDDLLTVRILSGFGSSFRIPLKLIESVIRVNIPADELCKEPEHDIAKERWEVNWREISSVSLSGHTDEHTLVHRGSATDSQFNLMAAAPELADLMREYIAHQIGFSIDTDWRRCVKKQIKLLRKLGIPDVAPWYKEE